MGLLCMAKEITIIPKFATGDTLKYRTTAQVIMHHGKDSLVSLTKLLPRLIVESRNDKGFIIRTTNSLESFDITCTDPESEGLLPDKTDELNDFVASVKLRIQLDAVGRPDSILNIDEVKETMLEAYIKMFKKEQGIDIENSDEWEIDTKPFLVSAVDMICAPKLLIEQQDKDAGLLLFNSGNSGGARPKAIFSDNDGHWIVKFRHTYDPSDMGVQEYHHNETARKCGITVPDFRLVSDRYFASRRFDIDENGNRPLPSMGQVIPNYPTLSP